LPNLESFLIKSSDPDLIQKKKVPDLAGS
jgi:hypothetical protein